MIIYMFQCHSPKPAMHDTGWSGLVHWDDPEGWDGEGGGKGLQDGEHMYTRGGFMSMYGKTNKYCKVTSLQSKKKNNVRARRDSKDYLFWYPCSMNVWPWWGPSESTLERFYFEGKPLPTQSNAPFTNLTRSQWHISSEVPSSKASPTCVLL